MNMTNTADEKLFSQSSKRALRNPWVIGWLALLTVVLTVNIGMIVTAFVSFPGLVEKDYYERGRDHEMNFLKEKAARAELGWKVGMKVPAGLVMGQPAQFRFPIQDKKGQPLTGAKVELAAYRPSDADADFRANLHETAPGVYEGTSTFALKGIWDITVLVGKDGHELNVTRRIKVAAQ